MVGIGTFVNVVAIVVGGLLGLTFRGGLNEKYQQAVIRTLGISTLFLGASGGLKGLENGDTLGMILSLAIGTLIGEILDFDGKLESFGQWLKERTSKNDSGNFVQGFVSASLVVCVGAMAIVGALQDALSGDPSTLYTKSILDFIIVMIFSSTYGRGAIFSAIPVLIIQGGVTLCATLVAPIFSAVVIENISFIGSLLIFCVGTNLAFDTKFRVANMLPALVLGSLYVSFL